ncbi:MAG: DUF3857 domain-containing protein [Chitinophagaceae bacterium]
MKVVINLFFLALLFPFYLIAQKDVNDKYKQEAEMFRKEVWGWAKPEFAVRTIPTEFANYSKVIIGRHVEINADSKKKSSIATWGFAINKQATMTQIVREAIKINDKVALDEYSVITYSQLTRKSSYVFDNITKVYVGIRVYKQDGNFREVNADDIILTRDDKNNKEAKIAVPDLQVGDIIDYFIASQGSMEAKNAAFPSYVFTVFDDCPIMSYSIHAQFGSKYAVEYRSYNKAPQFKVTENDGDNILDIQEKNIPAYTGLNLWSSPYRQLPIIRMNIMLPSRGGGPLSNERKKGEIYRDQGMDEFLEDEKVAIGYLKLPYAKSMFMVRDQSGVPSIAKNYYKKITRDKNISPDSLAAELFYLYRFSRYLDIWDGFLPETVVAMPAKGINEREYMYSFGDFLKLADVDNQLVFVTHRSGPLLKEIMSRTDMQYLLQVQNGKQGVFGMETIFTPPYYIPSMYEGIKDAVTLDIKGRKTVKPKDFDQGVVSLPVTKAEENARVEKMVVAIPGTDVIQVNRTTTLKGHYRGEEQKQLILLEDYCNAERKIYGADKTIVEELTGSEKNRKYGEELKAAFDKARLKQKDAFVTEAKEWFEQEITELSDNKVQNLGVRHTSPDFIYSSKFKMGGVIKKAGNNYILEIGKLQGSPLQIDPSQRKRKLDVYMPFARSINTEITIEIPPGYTAEGWESLNRKVENETGHFTVTTSVAANSVTIKVSKSYDHSFEPAANWDKLLAFLDAANDWAGAKLLIKKK